MTATPLNPFKTKHQLKSIESEHVQHRFKDDPTKFLHMTFPPNTWIADIVSFGHYLNKPTYWYLFIHGNSRYAILKQASLNSVEQDTDLYEFKPYDVKNAYNWTRTLDELLKAGIKINMLITDYETAWRGKEANRFYLQNNIIHEAVNVSVYGHSRLGILDRFVRTLRDMIQTSETAAGAESGAYEDDPNKLLELVEIYNNTKHRTLTRYLGKPTTPQQVLNDEELETQLTRAISSDNWSISHQPWYKIPVGKKVVVKETRNKAFSKVRGSALRDEWEVIDNEGQKYTLMNPSTFEEITVFRSQIKQAPKPKV